MINIAVSGNCSKADYDWKDNDLSTSSLHTLRDFVAIAGSLPAS